MSTQINDGGPAFPVFERWDGMTLRDWFAGQALVGLLHPSFTKLVIEDSGAETVPTITARTAYRVADAMLAEREKGASA